MNTPRSSSARCAAGSRGPSLRRAALCIAPVLLAAFLTSVPKASGITPLSPWENGIATNYGGQADGMSPSSPSFGTLAGACGYGALPQDKWPFWSVGALATSSHFYSAGPLNGCGQCFQVECLSTVDENVGACTSDTSLRSVVIMISDECPECASNQIDLQALTFDKMAPMAVGRMNIRYRRVECTPPADMKVDITDNGGAGAWIRLNVQETGGRGAVQGVQLQGSDGAGWQPMNNVWGAAWESTSVPSGSVSFRFVPDQGGEVTAFNVLNGSVTGMIPTRVQFTMHDQPQAAGQPQQAANQGVVEAFGGPPDFAVTTADSSASSSSPPSPGGEAAGPSPQSPSPSGRRFLRL